MAQNLAILVEGEILFNEIGKMRITRVPNTQQVTVKTVDKNKEGNG